MLLPLDFLGLLENEPLQTLVVVVLDAVMLSR